MSTQLIDILIAVENGRLTASQAYVQINDMNTPKEPRSELVPTKKGQAALFGEIDDKEAVFWESPISDLSIFTGRLIKEMHMGVNIEYYFQAVHDWCAQLPKRDKRRKKSSIGWIATARNFMRSDQEKGKLQMLNAVNEDTSSKMSKFLANR